MAPRKPLPLALTLKFDDGTTAEIPFGDLPVTLQADILRQPFGSSPSPEPSNEKYVLLEWKDGWREVFQVPPECTEINRYYVISRPEDFGRLSLNTANAYPELLEISRDPLNLKRLAFSETFQLEPKQSDREGNKIDHYFSLQPHGNLHSELRSALRKALADEGLELECLTNPGHAKHADACMRMAARLNLRPGRRRQDLLDFMACLASEG